MTRESWLAMFVGWIPDDGLHEAVANPADMLRKQGGPELLETGRGIIQRSDDRLALGNVQREDLHVSRVRLLEPRGERFVVDQAGQLEDEVVAYGKPSQEHTFDYDTFGDAA